MRVFSIFRNGIANLISACGNGAARAAALALVLLSGIATGAETSLSFHPQTGFTEATMSDSAGATLALAGRREDGEPVLALLRYRDGRLEQREIPLPDNAVAIDSGPTDQAQQAVFILCTDKVLRLDQFDGNPVIIAEVPSMYRGRSFAELTNAVDFARDLDGDGVADLVVQDFDAVHVLRGPDYTNRSSLALPSLRRGYDRAVTYRPARIAAVNLDGSHALVSVRGNTLLRFDQSGPGYSEQPDILPLEIGLSDEREIEAVYNGYENIDQSEIVLREPEIILDLNGDDIADLVTLETLSTGVFDKQSTYRVHFGRSDAGRLSYDAEPDTVLSSRGYQFGLRAAPIDDKGVALVSPGVEVGLRTIIGALFTKSVTMQIAIYAPDVSGVIPGDPNTTVKTKISFDFGSGRAELPTIAFGDFDGDGRNDLLLKRKGSQVVWRRNIGDGVFESDGRELDIAGPADGTAMIAVDLDGDERDEVVARYSIADGEGSDRLIRVQAVDSSPSE